MTPCSARAGCTGDIRFLARHGVTLERLVPGLAACGQPSATVVDCQMISTAPCPLCFYNRGCVWPCVLEDHTGTIIRAHDTVPAKL